ncbi:MAG: hypothetical protein RR140_00975 [Clostridia bacterium]
MTKDDFSNLVISLILPLFTGSSIIGEGVSTSRDSEVAQGSNGTVLVKAHKTDEYRFIIRRSQPFKTADVSLLRTIIAELVKISELNLTERGYVQSLQSTAIEKAVCQAVSENNSETILGVINSLSHWANRTYEGNHLNFGIIVNESEESPIPNFNLSYVKMLESDFFALLSDGKQSCVELDKNGQLTGHILMDRVRFATTLCPYEFINVARYCSDNRIGISYLANGDLLIFKNRELVFANRRDVWISYCHDEIIQLLSNRTSHTMKEIRKAIYFTALDCSFTNSGGCLAYLNKDKCAIALEHIDIHDIVSETHFELKKQMELDMAKNMSVVTETIEPENFFIPFADFLQKKNSSKTHALVQIIDGRKFHELSRKLRQEIIGMDGATIIDYDGTIIAVGAIVKIEAGSTGGGRLAATKTLAKYGVAVKISVDGTVEGYTFDKKFNAPKPIFSLG